MFLKELRDKKHRIISTFDVPVLLSLSVEHSIV